jgi:diguanylate cyclase (GGDEF)-like protein/PAS domain S-box-containing protein
MAGPTELPSAAPLDPREKLNDLRFADFLQEIVACFDPQLRHTYVNSAVELFTGLSSKDFIGKTNRELGMPKEQVDQWDRVLGEVFRSGKPSQLQFSFDTPGGTRLFHSTLTPQTNLLGVVTSVVTVARDVSVSPMAGLTAGLFKATIDASEDAIISKTLDGTVTSWNRGAEIVFGYSQAEMLGRSLLILFPLERQQEEVFILERLLHGEKVEHFDTIRIRKNGELVYVSVTISLIRDADGKIIGASKIARDITPLKREQERLQMALDTSSNGLWDWDLRTGRVYRSPHYFELTGYPPEDDTHDFAFFVRTIHPEDRAHVQQVISAYVAGKCDRIEFEYRLISKKGENGTWLQGKGRAVERNLAGVPLRIVGTLSDITGVKLAEMALRDREQRLSRVIEGSDQGYWDWNIQTNLFQVSPRWETMLGYEPGEMQVSPERWVEIVHPEDFPRTMQSVERHLRGETPMHESEIRCKHKSGSWRWILTRGKVVTRDGEGKPLMMSGTHTDIDERKAMELSQRDALTVFASSYEGIMVVDASGLITRINPAFTRITGYRDDEVVGKSPRTLASGRHDTRFYREMWDCIESTGFWSGEIWNRRKNGEVFAQILSISRVADNNGKVQNYIGMFSDISQIKAHEEELDRAAHYDPLTGAPNRRLLADRLTQSIARADRSELSLAVCYLDLDGFKAVNDRYGHSAGDKLLLAVTENLKQVLRADDTLARLGGDEFVLLLSDIGSPEECSLILERVLLSVNKPTELEGNTVAVSASIGVSLYPQDHGDADILMRHADQAMYLAKEAGKNRFHLFDPESDRKAQVHRRFVDRMKTALEQKEFRLFYQPQIDLSNGQIVGLEALIRWQHPESGLLSPSEFLPHLPGTTLERPIGVWVMHEALAQLRDWKTQGHDIHVSINVSAGHLLSSGFLEDLSLALRKYPEIPPHQLELEVLESTAIDDMALAASVLSQCRAIGVRLALDDFGTGYSSLTYLRKLPFDLLKIDQSFVRDMLKDPEDLGIVEGVIRLAAAFNRSVIAEGVETLEHGAKLLQLGCRLAQGYGIARPMPPENFVEWASRWNSGKAWIQVTANSKNS